MPMNIAELRDRLDTLEAEFPGSPYEFEALTVFVNYPIPLLTPVYLTIEDIEFPEKDPELGIVITAS